MKTPPAGEVTQLLVDWRNGDRAALDRLMPLVYRELHRLASAYMRRESPGHTLQTTALVNEAYLKLVDQKNVRWQNRAHFFGIAAQVMRCILVDHARAHARVKRGGGEHRLSLDEVAVVSRQRAREFVLLDDALKALAETDPRKSRIVEMRFFVGLSIEEIAEVEKLSLRTIEREWRKAKAWLYLAIEEGHES